MRRIPAQGKALWKPTAPQTTRPVGAPHTSNRWGIARSTTEHAASSSHGIAGLQAAHDTSLPLANMPFVLILRYEYDVIFAVPSCMTQSLIVFHCLFQVVALAAQNLQSSGRLPHKSIFESLSGRAGGLPLGSFNLVTLTSLSQNVEKNQCWT